MKNLVLVAVLISASSALANGWRGGHGGSHGGGGYHSARPVYVAPRAVYVPPQRVYVVVPRSVYVAPRPIHVAPRQYRPAYSYSYDYGYVPAPSVSFQLPFGAISLFIGSQPYFLSGGSFYLQTGQGYSAVEAPIGAAVSQLPPDATRQEINGYTYARSNGAWFVWDGNQGAWLVVNCPY